MEQPITVGCLESCDWLLHRFIEENCSKLTDFDQIFRNDFVCLYYHLSKISKKFRLPIHLGLGYYSPRCIDSSIHLVTVYSSWDRRHDNDNCPNRSVSNRYAERHKCVSSRMLEHVGRRMGIKYICIELQCLGKWAKMRSSITVHCRIC